MKKWYEVYFQFYDFEENGWVLGKMPFWKFIIVFLGQYFDGNNSPISDISYVSPKNVTIG